MRTGSAYVAGKILTPGPILKNCTVPLTVSKDLDAPTSKDKQKQTRLTSMVLFDILTLMNLTEYTLKKSKTNGAVRTDLFVKSSFPLWKIGYFFVLSKNLSKVALSCVFLSAIVLCQNSHALEGYATYYTEESCKREGTSGIWTASGQRFDENALTCAMRSRQWGKKLLVYSHDTGKSIIVTLNDFGPGKGPSAKGVVIDLTPAGMRALGIWGKGKVSVQEVL